MADDIAQWLEGLGLGQYAEAFAENEIEFDLLPKLTDDDLKELGVRALGHRKRLLEAAEALGPGERSTAIVTPPTRDLDAHPPEAERRQLTVMFCDLVGSTALSSQLDPEDMRDVIRSYQDACAEVVSRYEGFVAKYMGDGVLVYFGFPTAHEDDAERAINTGLGIVEAMQELDGDLAVRIGIATGTVVVGDIVGEGASQEAAIIGETPNLAARLQEIAEPNAVVIADTTNTLAGGLFEMVDLSSHNLKGFAEPVQVWSVSGSRKTESRFDATRSESLTELIGRDEEMEILLRRWDRTKSGVGQVVLISGEPGIGKSRLIRELQDRIADQPHFRLWHQCSPHHLNSALHPVIERLALVAGFEPGDSDGTKLDKLDALVSISGEISGDTVRQLAALLRIPTDDGDSQLQVTPQRQKELIFGALDQQLSGLAAQRPILFVMEDAHWIDPTTLELLESIFERTSNAAVMLLVTYRPEFVAPWIGRPRVAQMYLGRLELRDCGRMVERVAASTALPEDVRDRIAKQADGVPLFAEELTKSVLETTGGSLGPTAAIEVPSTLQDSLEARLDRLGAAKEVAQIGAAIGRSFDYDLLSRVVEVDEKTLGVLLSQLTTSGLLISRGEVPTAIYSFSHALVQDTAYNSLLRSRRIQLHARITETLERYFEDKALEQPEVLAHHCTMAEWFDKAAEYRLKAAQSAILRAALEDAVAHLDSGLETANRHSSDQDRLSIEISLLATRAIALRLLRGHGDPEAEENIDRAYLLCRRLDEAETSLPVLWLLFDLHRQQGRLVQANDDAGELLELADRSEGRVAALAARCALGMTNLSMGQNSVAISHLEEGMGIYDASKDEALAAKFLTDFGVDLSFRYSLVQFAIGYPDKARRIATDLVSKASDLKHPFSAGMAFGGPIRLFVYLRDTSAVLEAAEKALETAIERGFASINPFFRFQRGWAWAQNGRIDDGISEILEGISAWRSAGVGLALPYWNTVLAEAYVLDGRGQDALDLCEDALERIHSTKEHELESWVLSTKGDALLLTSRDELAQAETAYCNAIDVARSQSAKMWELRAAARLAHLWHSRRQTTEARDLLAPVYGWFTEGFDTADLKDAKALLDELS